MDNKRIAIITLVFPIVLAIGIFTIPFVSDYSNHMVTEAAAGHTARWFWGHMLSGIAFGIAIIAAHYITQYLHVRGQKTTGAVSLILITLGGSLLAIGLGADGVGPVATISGGAQAFVFFDGSGMMVSGIFMAGVMLFGFGTINQIIGMQNTGSIPKLLGVLQTICAVAFMGASAIPSTLGLYILALLTCILYGSLALHSGVHQRAS